MIASLPSLTPAARTTFRAELVRAVATGAIETALTTFAILIAVRVFDSSAIVKSLLLGCPAIGLLGSLWIVRLVGRRGWLTSRAAAVLYLISAAGFG
ncbi:MAG: hypothetical protein AAF236_10740, partial [Verrucomicrobiota bacterium]